ncbi:MAG: cytochrome c biogenesis protein CcsA [Candidatus Cyclobacteriaceae bacterium M2_1C_046]
MIHTFIGDLGHLFVIISFISSITIVFAYLKSQKDTSWNSFANNTVIAHFLAITGVVACLYIIISQHYYEYHYAYSHSSNTLPWYYMISAFWEGQEGSFLLWMWWNAVIGLFLIKLKMPWKAPVLVVFGVVQLFLTSMILGVVIPGLEAKIGSSPFILLRDAMEAPIFQVNPDFVPDDGSGLNPLLQNYWMVIHPPVLFLGFALTMVPFAFAIAGLWLKKYTEWIEPVKPWTVLAAAVLGLGILMGGYWAYETLNFGGYWNWDPVENAVYVPWLILIAAIHTMLVAKKNPAILKLSLVLSGVVFILILYSTFLTRSGVLGDSSVHSFTDLGLSGQLLIYLLTFTVGFIIILAIRWKDMPTSKEDMATSKPEFWLFIGALVLCLMGFQVLIPTSIPVYNNIINALGMTSQVAPPADQVEYYSKFQLWFAVAVAILSAIAVVIYWRKNEKESLLNYLAIPLVITLILSLILIEGADLQKFSFIILLVAAVFTLVVNVQLLFKISKKKIAITGGSVAHIGMALMLIGILFSAGFDRVVSLNTSGLLISAEQDTEFNNENLLLFINEPRRMGPFTLSYLGERWETRDKGVMIDKYKTTLTGDPNKVIATEDIAVDEKLVYSAGDTIGVYGENTYYEVEYKDDEGKTFYLFPRAQINEAMGGLLASPDIKRNISKDLYTHVSSVRNPEEPVKWSEIREDTIEIKTNFFVNDYVAEVHNLRQLNAIPGLAMENADVAVEAVITLQGEYGTYEANPIFIIRDNKIGRIPAEIPELGVRIYLVNILPEQNSVIVGYNTRQKDWIVLKAVEKPWINILWLGTGVLMVGFGMSTYRKFRDA